MHMKVSRCYQQRLCETEIGELSLYFNTNIHNLHTKKNKTPLSRGLGINTIYTTI